MFMASNYRTQMFHLTDYLGNCDKPALRMRSFACIRITSVGNVAISVF